MAALLADWMSWTSFYVFCYFLLFKNACVCVCESVTMAAESLPKLVESIKISLRIKNPIFVCPVWLKKKILSNGKMYPEPIWYETAAGNPPLTQQIWLSQLCIHSTHTAAHIETRCSHQGSDEEFKCDKFKTKNRPNNSNPLIVHHFC